MLNIPSSISLIPWLAWQSAIIIFVQNVQLDTCLVTFRRSMSLDLEYFFTTWHFQISALKKPNILHVALNKFHNLRINYGSLCRDLSHQPIWGAVVQMGGVI